MQKYVRIGVLVTVIMIGAGVVFSSSVSASSRFYASETKKVVISENETVDGSAYLVAPTVEIDGTVNGDVYCAGEKIIINGTVTGDVMCFGSTITLDGTVNGDVRLVASEVSLAGSVEGSAGILASKLVATESFSLNGDFSVAGEEANIAGIYGRDVAVAARSFSLQGDVTRNLSANTENFSIGSQGAVGGNLWYKSLTTISNNDMVSGTVTHEPQTEPTDNQPSIWTALYGILMIITLAVLTVLIAPRYVHTAASQPVRRVLVAFLIGITTVLLLPLVAVLVMLSSIGLLFGIGLFLAWLLLITMSFAFTSYYVGSLVLQKRGTNALLVALAGGAVIGMLTVIPFLNALVVIGAVTIGVGMQVMHIKYQFSKDPYKITP